MPPRRLDAHSTATAPAAPAAAKFSVFDCLFFKKGQGAAEGTLVVRCSKAQLLDLQLREKATDSLPPAIVTALHTAHSAALAASSCGVRLWQQEEGPPQIAVGLWQVEVEDDAAGGSQRGDVGAAPAREG